MPSIRTSSLAAALCILGSISRATAHGWVTGIVIGENYFPGFNPGAAPYQNPPPPVIGWPNGASDTGFVSPSAYSNEDIICHLSSRPGERHASVAAGSSINLQWNQWPESHHGPVLDYMARCDGECENANKNALEFFKIAEAGLNDGSPAPGNWASDDLIANNKTWTVTIPASIAPGNYVLRHEIIALHSADKPDGAQNYPQCINLEVTGSGTENPAGIPATSFYTPNDPGILVSIYYPALENYTIPGPPLFTGASSGPESPLSASATVSPSLATATVIPPASSPASEVPTVVESSVATAPTYGNSATSAEELTSTTTTDTTITLTTFVPGSTPTDVFPTTAEEQTTPTPTFEPYPDEPFPDSEIDGNVGIEEIYSDPAPGPTDLPETTTVDPAPTVEATLTLTVSPTPAVSPTPTDPVPLPAETFTPEAPPIEEESTDPGAPTEMSINDFIAWLRDLIAQYFAANGSRIHARDLALT